MAGARAHAQDEGLSEDDIRARTHFEAGRSYFEEGAYDRAREEFQRAYDLSRRPALLINLATVNERLAHYEEAIRNIQAYLSVVPDDPQRVTLERRVANLQRLHEERGSTAPPPIVGGSDEGGGMDGGMLGGMIAGYGVAVVGVVLMATFGSMALSEDAELRDTCGITDSCTAAQVADADTFALVSDIGMAVAIAGAAAGTIFLILGLTSGGGGESATISPWLSPEGGGVAVRARF